MSKRPLAPKGGNDRIMTPICLAQQIIDHFKPRGEILEPCKGEGAFFDEMRKRLPRVFWCEITEGVDFFKEIGAFDWIVTNPPWSQFRAFLVHSMKLADNIVFLCLINAWYMKARQDDMCKAGFGIVEILHVPTPPPPWPQTGFALGAGWVRRGWTGSTHHNYSKMT